MPPKHFYTISWTQPYTFGVGLEELDALMAELIELDIEAGNMDEAKEALQRIMNK